MCNELRDPSHQTSDSPTLQRRSALPHRGIAMGAREAGGAVRWRLAPRGLPHLQMMTATAAGRK